MLLNPCRRHRTISSQLSTTVRTLQSESSTVQELCRFRNAVPKTFPVEVRPSQRVSNKDSSKVLLTLSKANLAFTDVLNGVPDREDYLYYTPDSTDPITAETRHSKERRKAVVKVFSSTGAELADQFVLKYPRTFTMRFSDNVPCAGHHITDTCIKQDYVKGYEIFQTMKKSKTPIPVGDANKLLDLFCYHSYRNPKAGDVIPARKSFDPLSDPEPEEKPHISIQDKPVKKNPQKLDVGMAYNRFYHVGNVDVETSDSSLWSDSNAACELFGYMASKDSVSYNLLIQYMVKHARNDPELLDKAQQLFKDMVRLELKPSLRTVKALIYNAGYCHEMLQDGRKQNVLSLISPLPVDFKPDAEVLLLLLKACSTRRGVDQVLVDDFLQSDIPCSFWELRGLTTKDRNWGRRRNYEIFRKLQHVLTSNCSELNDYELLKIIPDYATELTAEEVVEFLDYIVTSGVMTRLPTDKPLFARQLLHAFSLNKDGDLESLKLVIDKLKDVLWDDIKTQQDCLRFTLDKASRLGPDALSSELIEVAERLNELEPNKPYSNCIIWYTSHMIQHCSSIANRNKAEMKEKMKQLQAINIENMLKIQNNDLYPNTEVISSLILTTLYSGDKSNAWELLNLYQKYLLEPDLKTTQQMMEMCDESDSKFVEVLNPSMLKHVQLLREELVKIRVENEKANKKKNKFKKKISKADDVVEIL